MTASPRQFDTFRNMLFQGCDDIGTAISEGEVVVLFNKGVEMQSYRGFKARHLRHGLLGWGYS